MAGAVFFTPVKNHEESEEHATQVCEMGYAVVGAGHAGEELDGGVDDDEPASLDGKEEIQVDVLVGEHETVGQQDAVDGAGGSNGGDADDGLVVEVKQRVGGHETETAGNILALSPGVGFLGYPFGVDDAAEMVVGDLYQRFGRRIGGIKVDVVENGCRRDPGDCRVDQSGADAAYKIEDQEAAGAPEVFKDIAKHPEGEHVEEYMLHTSVHEHIGDVLPGAEHVAAHEIERQMLLEVESERFAQDKGGGEEKDVDDQQVFDTGGEHAESLGAVLLVHGVWSLGVI